MSNTTVNISLPETMRAQIEQAVSAGGYGNTSEFFRDLAREYLRKKQEQQQQLELLLLEAIKNNDFAPLSGEAFDDMKAALAESIEDKNMTSRKEEKIKFRLLILEELESLVGKSHDKSKFEHGLYDRIDDRIRNLQADLVQETDPARAQVLRSLKAEW